MPILKEFRTDDTSTETFTTTYGFFDGGVGQLSGNQLTSASLSTGQDEYYINLQYNSKDHLSIAYGNYHGSGSSDAVGQTKAVYRQFSSYLLDPNETGEIGFVFSGSATVSNRVNDVFFLTAERLQMKDRLNKKNWSLVLTGSNTAGDAGVTVHLTDDSEYAGSTATPVGPRYNVISGSAGNKGNNSISTIFGHFWPNVGVIALDGNQLSASLPGTGSDASNTDLVNSQYKDGFGNLNRSILSASPGVNNTLKLMDCMCTAGDAAGRTTNVTHQFRSEEEVTTNSYFCRAKADEYNYSNNPTFTSGSDNSFTQPTFVSNPTTYITEVGLYDGEQTLIAVAKLSSPVEKNFSSEAVIKINLTY
tara:strand:+ start:2282 stop:3367 length:1086 start_codon:yes stop_codon:yes gene_type:complete